MTRKPPIVTASKGKKNNSVHPRAVRRGRGASDDSFDEDSKPTRNRRKKTPARKRRSFIFGLIKWMLVLCLWCGIIGAGALAWFAKDLPDIAKAANFQRRSAIIVKAADGSTIARYGELKGDVVNLRNMPDHLPKAVMAVEDRRFYDHPGVDIFGIARAMSVNIIRGRTVQGGSTITQQLAKNLFLTHERAMTRKVQEALLALWLEHQLTKDEILTAYLNRVYLGAGVYGVGAASQIYFGKDVKDITLYESAVLAGLLKAPSRYSPLNNPTLAKRRAQTVLAAMVDAGYITEQQSKNANTQLGTPASKPDNGGGTGRYFSDWVIEGLDDIIGTPDMDIVVETTLDTTIQNAAENTLRKILNEQGKEKKVSQGAVLVMRPDGTVLAMVGGRDYGQSQFNRVVQAMRSTGSSFKPIVYLAALRTGATPDTRVPDEPITTGKYRPENFGKKYYGDISLREALAYSTNTATVRIANKAGISNIIKTARDLGVISKLEPDLSIALGSSGIPMLEMGTAYATIANGGHSAYPYAITRITSSDGRVLYERKPQTMAVQVIDTRSVQNLKSIMRSAIDFGTGQRAKLPFTVMGKTGTSQDSRDAWFIGFSDEIVTSVWLGNDDNSPMNNVTGALMPVDIWREVMQTAHGRYAPVSYASYNIHTGYDANDIESAGGSGGGIGRLIGRLLGGGGNTQPPPQQQNRTFND